MTRPLVHRCLAEVVGTALLVGIGTGGIVGSARAGSFSVPLVVLAWFLAVFLPIVLFVRISGAHLNPAVTLALAASGRFERRAVPPYLAGQFAGAFLGSASLWGLTGSNAHLGATVPRIPDLALAMGGEAVFTALLVAAVFLLSDLGEGSSRWRLTLPAAAVALSTWLIGPWSGCSLNPARSLAPAVLSGTYTDLWAYVITVVLSGLAIAAIWRATPPDRRTPWPPAAAPFPDAATIPRRSGESHRSSLRAVLVVAGLVAGLDVDGVGQRLLGVGCHRQRLDRRRPAPGPRVDRDPPDPAAHETGPHPAPGPEPRADRPAIDPERRASPTVKIPVLREEPDVVAHPDPAGERNVPAGPAAFAAHRLALGEGEEIRDPLARDPDHRARAPTPAPPALQG
jgi:glycerol uptake facilitator-like aquaporin